MANVIIIRPISESWEGELYKRALSIPHGPLALSAHLIDKGFDPLIIDEIALTETIQTQISERAVDMLKSELKKKLGGVFSFIYFKFISTVSRLMSHKL